MSTTNDNGGSNLDGMSLEAIEAELKNFEIEERKRLGLPVDNAKHWFDAVPREFTRDQREQTGPFLNHEEADSSRLASPKSKVSRAQAWDGGARQPRGRADVRAHPDRS